MNKEQKLVPELRFPEFVNEGEWVEKTLNKFGNLINGLTYSPEDIRENGLLVLRSSNVQNGQIDLDDCVYVKPDVKGANLAQPDDILVCIRNGSKALIGKNAIIPKGIPLATHGAFMTVFRAESPKFVFQLFQTDAYNNQVNADLGATINSINGGNFLKYKFPTPKSAEQQKIASCLSSLDELINAQTQKLDALKDHKKGLMQQLFPAEGETVPKLRFKEFENDGEWVGKSMDSLTIKISDGIHTTPNYDDAGEYFFINGNNLIDGKILIDEKTKRVSEHEYIIHKRNLDDSTILLSINGTIGNLAIYNNEKVILGKSACYINVDMEKIEKNFVVYFIQTDFVSNYFNSELTGSTIKNLSLKSIKETIVKVPPKPKEQQKIANFLSSIDEEITAQTQKIEALKEHKKGLMQGLFPVMSS